MTNDMLENARVSLLLIGVCALLLQAAACGTEATPYWGSSQYDAGTRSSPFGVDPDGGQDAGTDDGSGNTPACGEGKQGFNLDGDHNGGTEPWVDFDVIYPNRLRLDEDNSSFTAEVLGDGVIIRIFSDNEIQRWHALFRTRVPGEQLQPGVYQVQETEEEQTGPTMEIEGNSMNYPAQVESCGYRCGTFEIQEIDVSGSQVNRFKATFEQHCRCAPAALRGCVSYRP
jgi:hypothetical protein